jgi:hypothetical protein
MADQLAAGGGSGSPQRVAYDLWNTMRADSPSFTSTDFKKKVKGQLDLYQQCLRATRSGIIDTSDLT